MITSASSIEANRLPPQEKSPVAKKLKFIIHRAIIGTGVVAMLVSTPESVGNEVDQDARSIVGNRHSITVTTVNSTPELQTNKTETERHQEIQAKLDQIVAYREELGLNGLPSEFEKFNFFAPDEEWPIINTPIAVNINPAVNYYAMRASEVYEEVFGNNAPNFIKGISFTLEGRIAFHAITQTFIMTTDITIRSPDDTISLLLHEVIGHPTGPDSAMNNDIPIQVRLNMFLGQWKALSQAYNIPGELFNHPGDSMKTLFESGDDVDIDTALNEIWAEMVRLTLEPSSTDYNNIDLFQTDAVGQTIRDGVRETLAAATGNPTLELQDIRDRIAEPSQSVANRYDVEKPLRDQLLYNLQLIPQTVELFYEGTIPEYHGTSSQSEIEVVQQYAELVKALVDIYPILLDNTFENRATVQEYIDDHVGPDNLLVYATKAEFIRTVSIKLIFDEDLTSIIGDEENMSSVSGINTIYSYIFWMNRFIQETQGSTDTP